MRVAFGIDPKSTQYAVQDHKLTPIHGFGPGKPKEESNMMGRTLLAFDAEVTSAKMNRLWYGGFDRLSPIL